MAKKGTLVVRFIGDTKEFDQANKKMGTGLSKTGKAIDSSLTKPLGEAGTATTQLGKDFDSSSRKINSALSGTKRNIDTNLTQPTEQAGMAAKGLGKEFQTQTRKIETAIGGTRAEVKQFENDVKDIKVKVGFDGDEAESGLDSMFTGLKGAAATGGLALGAAAVAAFMDGMNAEADVDRVAAQLGLNEKESKRLGRISGRIFANAWAGSVGEAAEAVGAVQSSIDGMGKASEKTLQRVSSKVSAYADLFGVDVARAAQVAGQAVRVGFAQNADQALDLLYASTQRVPAAVREDLLDALDEYGPFLQTLGFKGQEAFGLLVKGAEKGMYGIDKTGDAIKEFTIRATDMSTTSVAAYKAIGLDAEAMSSKILKGGNTSKAAFDKIIDGLLGIKDPVKRANTAIALFGVPLEDLSVREIPKFLRGLRDSEGQMKNFSGTAQRAMGTMSDNVQADFQTLINNVRLGGQELVAGILSGDWDKVGKGFKRIWENIKQIFKDNWEAILIVVSLGTGLVIREIIKRWDKIAGFFKGIWNKIVGFFKGAWNTIKNIVTGGLNAVKNYYVSSFNTWRQLFSNVWNAISRTTTTVVNNIKEFIGRLFTETIPGIFRRGWDMVKGIFKSAWGLMNRVIREGIAEIVEKFLSFVEWILNAADKAFGWIPGIGDKLDGAVQQFQQFKEGVNAQIRGIDSTREIRLETIAGKKFQALIDSGAGHPAWTGNRAMGGPIEGGKAGRDSVPIMAMPGEHVWTTREVKAAGGHGAMKQMRQAVKNGGMKGYAEGGPIERQKGVYPDLVGEKAMIGKFRQAKNEINRFMSQVVMFIDASKLFPAGRVGAALKWARSQVGKPYDLGGVGPGAYDCSGFMSAITNFLRGKSIHSRVGTTATFPWPGFAAGADPKGFTIGSTPSYPGSSMGHMAGTLAGVNVESSGGVGVRVGKGARGFNDSGFTEVYHLTGIKGGVRVRGGDTGALSRGEKFIIRAEAGGLFNTNANNPISSAFGLGQLLESNRIKYARRLGFNAKMERGDTGTRDRDKQIAMMRAYIRDRYGSTENAVAFHRSHGYYDSGGILPPGVTIAHNNTGRNEYVTRNRPGRSRSFEAKITNWAEGMLMIREISRETAREEVEDEFRYQAGV